jgi:hypothetical protein
MWARNQNCLGIALYRIGAAQENLAILNKSLGAYSSALEVLLPLSTIDSESVENNVRLVQVKIEELGSLAVDKGVNFP